MKTTRYVPYLVDTDQLGKVKGGEKMALKLHPIQTVVYLPSKLPEIWGRGNYADDTPANRKLLKFCKACLLGTGMIPGGIPLNRIGITSTTTEDRNLIVGVRVSEEEFKPYLFLREYDLGPPTAANDDSLQKLLSSPTYNKPTPDNPVQEPPMSAEMIAHDLSQRITPDPLPPEQQIRRMFVEPAVFVGPAVPPGFSLVGTHDIRNQDDYLNFLDRMVPGFAYGFIALLDPTKPTIHEAGVKLGQYRKLPPSITLEAGLKPGTFIVARTPPLTGTQPGDFVNRTYLDTEDALITLAESFGHKAKSLSEAIVYLETKIGTTIPDTGYFGL